MNNSIWATIVIVKGQGGRATITNNSSRGLFTAGDSYFNHRLAHYAKGATINVTIRLSRCGRRMVQAIRTFDVNEEIKP